MYELSHSDASEIIYGLSPDEIYIVAGNENKKIMFKNIITFTTLLLAFSAIGLLFFPSRMLGVVGIVGNDQLDFLLRASGVGVAALVPGAWALRTSPVSPASRCSAYWSNSLYVSQFHS